MSNILRKACEECVADRGREDNELVQRLHDYIHENFEKQGKPWNYILIDSIINALDKEEEFRELDGVYFRIQRNGKWKSICFSDLTDEEKDEILKDKDEVYLRSLCKILGKTIRDIGDQFNIKAGD